MSDVSAGNAPGVDSRARIGPWRWWGRRVVIVAVVTLQLVALVAAYGRPHKVFGWQMFNASSDWQATIVRVEADGTRHDVRDSWPGGYKWGTLVAGRGLKAPFSRHHADSGLDTTLDLFQNALDWVAENTPDDDRTSKLEAEMMFWDNGRGPFFAHFESVGRAGGFP